MKETEVLFMDALENELQMKYILGPHEVVVVGMGESYLIVSGRVRVINLHTCASSAAAMLVLLNAYRCKVSLLVTAGQQNTRLLMQEPALTGDLMKMESQFTK